MMTRTSLSLKGRWKRTNCSVVVEVKRHPGTEKNTLYEEGDWMRYKVCIP